MSQHFAASNYQPCAMVGTRVSYLRPSHDINSLGWLDPEAARLSKNVNRYFHSKVSHNVDISKHFHLLDKEFITVESHLTTTPLKGQCHELRTCDLSDET